jgi:hypothetical protein
MSLDDVARVTKIQPRILERLEAGKLDGLPAEVFVRGFVRSFARCVGLDEDEALRRHASCGGLSASGSLSGSGGSTGSTGSPGGSLGITPAARALVEAMAELVPGSATAARATPRKMLAVEVIDLASVATIPLPETGPLVMSAPLPAPAAEAMTDSFPVAEASAASQTSTAVVVASTASVAEPDAPPLPVVRSTVDSAGASLSVATPQATPATPATQATQSTESSKKKRGRRTKARDRRKALAMGTPAGASPVVIDEPTAAAPWAPRMPPTAAVASAPWRKPAVAGSAVVVVPRLVIDDADPDSAERILEERAEKQAPRRSFLPPILLDREDRSARQGGLTLAVIILLIAATLTLSYLMRRPSASGDGMTRLETPASEPG